MERKGKSIKAHHHATQGPTPRLAVRARNAHLHLPRRPSFEFEITRGDKVVEKECGHLQGMTEFAATNNHSSDGYLETTGGFSKNLKIEYSQYLKKLYGFKEPRALR